MTLKLTARVMTEDGVKYTCHCDWESCKTCVEMVICSVWQHEDAVGCPVSLFGVVGVVPDLEGSLSFPYPGDGSFLRNRFDDYKGCC